MASVPWMKVFDTVTTLARTFAPEPGPNRALGAAERGALRPADPASEPRGLIEARLAGVVVAALKEAFDRDKARMDLERETAAAERARAERALEAELRRQAADRMLLQIRTLATFAAIAFLVSTLLAAWLPGMRAGVSAFLLGAGWLLVTGALGWVFALWQQVTAWAAAPEPANAAEQAAPGLAAIPWLVVASFACLALSVLLAR